MYVNSKMTAVESVPGIWGGERRREFKYDIFDTL
jgi:hypothetical protein